MAIVLAILVSICFWAMSFKLIFNNKYEFYRGLKFGVYEQTKWKWNDSVGPNFRAVIKLYLWFALGGALGYLVFLIANS